MRRLRDALAGVLILLLGALPWVMVVQGEHAAWLPFQLRHLPGELFPGSQGVCVLVAALIATWHLWSLAIRVLACAWLVSSLSAWFWIRFDAPIVIRWGVYITFVSCAVALVTVWVMRYHRAKDHRPTRGT